MSRSKAPAIRGRKPKVNKPVESAVPAAVAKAIRAVEKAVIVQTKQRDRVAAAEEKLVQARKKASAKKATAVAKRSVITANTAVKSQKDKLAEVTIKVAEAKKSLKIAELEERIGSIVRKADKAVEVYADMLAEKMETDFETTEKTPPFPLLRSLA